MQLSVPQQVTPGVRHYLTALLFTAAAVGVRAWLDRWLGQQLSFVTLFWAIALSVWFSGTRPAIVSLIVGYVACTLLFVAPRGHMFHEGATLAGLVAYALSGSAIIAFGHATRAARARDRLTRERLQAEIRDRKRAESSLARHAQRLQLVWEAAGVLMTTEDAGAMLRRVFAKVAPHLGVDLYISFAADESRPGLRLVAADGVPSESVPALTQLHSGQTVCEIVAAQRRSVVLTDIQRSDDPAAALARSWGLQAYACNPLIASDRLLGTLAFGSRTKPRFEPEELEFLGTISHYVALAYERMRLVGELREGDRRKDEFLATLAHELRNPLAPIRTGLDVLNLSPTDDVQAARAREMMDRQLRHLVRLVDDLLDVSRISRGKIELRRSLVTLQDVVEHAVEASRPLVRAGGQELELEVPPLPIWVDGDLTRLSQVVSNLVNNAAKYTQPGGRIEVSVTREGDQGLVRVRDDGVGISQEMLPKIFGLFAQDDRMRDRAQGGLGIGLALVRTLVFMHDGTVEAHSPGPGKGSTFTLRLPLTNAPDASKTAPHAGAPARDARRCSILVVDDNEDAAEMLATMLELTGHEVQTAHDGTEALDATKERSFDVVFLDIGLPGIDGYEVAKRARRQPTCEHTLFVALTGWGSDDDKRRSKEAGFSVHLTKPVDPSRIDTILSGLA